MSPLLQAWRGFYFLVLLVLRMPIAIAMSLVGFAGCLYLVSPEAALRIVAKDLYSTFSSYSLSVIPMFVWMGFLAFHSGIGAKLYNFAYKLLGHLPGGLAVACQASCAVFGAVCGSNTATAATMGAIAIPEMRKYDYDASLATASVAAAGALAVLIPPSVIFVVYGIATEQSIGKLSSPASCPASCLLCSIWQQSYLLARRNQTLARRAPERPGVKCVGLAGGLPEVLIVFIISIGGLFAGWFTPTEAGAVGAFGVLVVSLVEGHLSWGGLRRSLRDTTRTTAMIMFLVGGATIFGRFIAISRIPFELATWAAALPLPSYMIMGIILLIYLVLGCFIDALAMILLTIPIFYPVAVEVLGYDPIWFGVIIVMTVAMGVITPPVGMNVYIIKGVARDIPLEVIFKGIWPFLIAILITCAL